MDRNYYNTLDIPALRLLLIQRNIPIGDALSKNQLIDKLVTNDLTNPNILPTTPPINRAQIQPTVPTRPQFGGITRPIRNYGRNDNIGTIPTQTNDRNTIVGPVSPPILGSPRNNNQVTPIIQPATVTNIIPFVPLVRNPPTLPNNEEYLTTNNLGTTNVPIIPITENTNNPTFNTYGEYPLTQRLINTRRKIIPTNKTPVIPVNRIPATPIPVTPGAIITGPKDTFKYTPTANIPIVNTKFFTDKNRGTVTPLPTRDQVPVTPTIFANEVTIEQLSPTGELPQPAENIEESIRGKLLNANFEVYDFVWKKERGKGIRKFKDGKSFGVFFEQYQKIPNDFVTSQYVIGYLMESVPPIFIAQLVTGLGFDKLTGTIDVFYNLLWYLNIADNPYATGLNNMEKSYISGLDINELLIILGNNYRGPIDKASLIFAILSGKSAQKVEINRYNYVASFPPNVVWNLAYYLYNIVNKEYSVYSLFPPYIHVAFQNPSIIEPILLALNENNVDELISKYGIVIPQAGLDNILKDHVQKFKVKFFIEIIKKYEPIFSRNPEIVPPPILVGKTKTQTRNILYEYTMKEIIDTYEPTRIWYDYNELIDRIIEDAAVKGSKWTWRNLHCNNDDTFNIIEAEIHGDIDKNNPDDPTLSYGVQLNYRCYQASELIINWKEDPEDHIFHFNVPDWISPNNKAGLKQVIDPTTGTFLINEFPVESIRQLKQLLTIAPKGYNIKELLDKVNEGLASFDLATRLLRKLKGEYEVMSAESKRLVELYLVWLFTYGMWLRFWKGPGNSWPTKWVEGGGGNDRCEIGRRDVHIFIQQGIQDIIKDQYNKDAKLKNWIEDLPLIDYNFKSGQATVAIAGTVNIISIVNRIQQGDFCMAHGSDLILKTSYYLIVRLLNFTDGAQFNTFIDNMIPEFITLETQVINYQLDLIKDIKDPIVASRANSLKSRQRELTQPIKPQPPFDPTIVGQTYHTDPRHGYKIQFADQ